MRRWFRPQCFRHLHPCQQTNQSVSVAPDGQLLVSVAKYFLGSSNQNPLSPLGSFTYGHVQFASDCILVRLVFILSVGLLVLHSQFFIFRTAIESLGTISNIFVVDAGSLQFCLRQICLKLTHTTKAFALLGPHWQHANWAETHLLTTWDTCRVLTFALFALTACSCFWFPVKFHTQVSHYSVRRQRRLWLMWQCCVLYGPQKLIYEPPLVIICLCPVSITLFVLIYGFFPLVI